MLPARTTTASILLAIVAVCSVSAQVFEVSRATIAGGGVLHAEGGGFDLSGTIGQHTVGAMSGAGFILTGGLWFPTPPGDCNEDGLVALPDHALFIFCANGPAGGEVDPACECYNVDVDGDIDLADYAQLQAAFTGD